MAAKTTNMASTFRVTATANRYSKPHMMAMSMSADSARSENRFMQSSQANFKRFPAIKMTAPQMKGGITQGAPTNFQLAVQKKQNEAKIAVGAGVLATAMSFFNPAPAMATFGNNGGKYSSDDLQVISIKAFRMFDLDGDKVIERNEFKKGVTEYLEGDHSKREIALYFD